MNDIGAIVPDTMTPRVSFFVPTYQYGHYLAYCVESILAQTETDFEVLILDDCSSDNTPDVAQQLVQQDERVRYIRHETNKGHIANYNFGIEASRGEWLWCLSADDALASPDILKRFITVMDAHPEVGLLFCRAQCMDGDSQPYEKWVPRQNYGLLSDVSTIYEPLAFYKKILQENFVPVASALARREAYEKVGLYHPRLTHSGDWFLWMQFCLDWHVYYEPEALVYYRLHQSNMHRTYENKQHAVDNSIACYEELLAYLERHEYGHQMKLLATLALIRYKRKHERSLDTREQFLHSVVRPFVSLNH